MRKLVLYGLLLIIIGSIILIVSDTFHSPKEIYRKKEVRSFIETNYLFEKSEKAKLLFFVLNQCGPCSEELLANFISLSSKEIVKDIEILIVCTPNSYGALMPLEETTNIRIIVFEPESLEDAGFLVSDDFLYIFNEKARLKAFFWLGSLTYDELSKAIERME